MGIRKTIAAVIAVAMVLSMTACADSEKPNDIMDSVSGNIKIKTDYKAMWEILPEIEETPIENLVYEYDVEASGMVITGYKAQSPKVRIPDKIEGEPVVGVNLPDSTITEIIMPDTVKRAVLKKSCLQYANYPLSLETYEDLFGEMSGAYSYSAPGSANEAFSGSAIEAVYIPNGVKYIPSSAFKNCSSLKEINLPNSVTEINDDAFYGCKSLVKIAFPDNLSYLGSHFIDVYASEGTVITYKGKEYRVIEEEADKFNKLYEIINFRDGLQIRNGVLMDTVEDITEAVIPDSVTEISRNAFRNRKNLKSVIIPDSVTEIGDDFFSGSENVVVTYKGKTYDYKHIDLLYVAVNYGESGILIKDGVLKGVSKELTEVTIPNGTAIIENAFKNCVNLISVTLPDSVHTIDKSAFSDCKNVKVTHKGKSYSYEQLDDLYNIINNGCNNITVYLPDSYAPQIDISSESVYMVNLDTDTVVVSKNSDERLYPNSTAMIMTCLVAFENISDLNVGVKCPYYCFDEFFSENPNFMGATNAGIEPMQDNLTYRDCLYAIMLGSGCEAANIIAYNAGGESIERFVDMMNETAQKIGCKNTHFSNPHGLFTEDNYTTAYDMYLITKYAIDNYPQFMEICGTYKYDMPNNKANPNGYSIIQTNRMMDTHSEYYYEGCTGIKTGSIDAYYHQSNGRWDIKNPVAGTRSLVTIANRNGYNYLCVTLTAPYENSDGIQSHYADHANLYNWAFGEFELKQIITTNQQVMEVGIKMGKDTDKVGVITTEGVTTLIPKSLDISAIQQITPSVEPFTAPIYKGKGVGNLEVRLGGETIAIIPLVIEHDVLRQSTDDISSN